MLLVVVVVGHDRRLVCSWHHDVELSIALHTSFDLANRSQILVDFVLVAGV